MPDEDPAMEALAREIRTGLSNLTWRLRAHRQAHGASPLSLAILSRLHRVGTQTPKALADAEGIQPQSLTRALASLEERGLVSRRPDPEDGRQSLMDITGEGLRVLVEDTRRRETWLAGALATLTPTEREVLRLAAGMMSRLADL